MEKVNELHVLGIVAAEVFICLLISCLDTPMICAIFSNMSFFICKNGKIIKTAPFRVTREQMEKVNELHVLGIVAAEVRLKQTVILKYLSAFVLNFFSILHIAFEIPFRSPLHHQLTRRNCSISSDTRADGEGK
jgi:hypothetical protein